MKLLVVEDDPGIARMLTRGLTQAGFVVDSAADGRTGLALAEEHSYGVILLDVMLPGLDGWQVCERLREDGSRVPILMLTARDGVGDRIKGLDLGADDYLPKPFDFGELLARRPGSAAPPWPSCWPGSAPSCAGTRSTKPACCTSPI